ncbi:DUF86 domain-containing protein [uncultured Agrobacterium sp.]|uniref:HepT-like ribonuclease domain-containing protein n=1 Tax=uncultured Agrobacterium sp. TaxID=157277 RepID=UPI0025849D91|nr:DUF86 domain-containing protein [uncultured Agrobacterium sp.]
MSAERLRVYIDEMTQVAAETVQFVHGMTKDDFLKDIVRQRAVGMNLLMIGETVVHLLDEYPEFAADFSYIPWKQIRGMRNRIAHGYMTINLDTVWDTTQHAIPELLEKLTLLGNWRAQGE